MPKKIPISEIKQLIGEENFRKLKEKYPCQYFYIPNKNMNFDNQEQKECYIKNLFFNSGWTAERIAESMELSVDRVRKIICSKAVKAPPC